MVIGYGRDPAGAAGPIRAVFELTYEPWEAAGRKVSEVKRISLDLGSNFNRFDCRFSTAGGDPLTIATGVKIHGGGKVLGAVVAADHESRFAQQKGQATNAKIAPDGEIVSGKGRNASA